LKRILFLLVVVALGCLAAGVAMAAPSHDAASPATTISSDPLSPDPYLGGAIESKVPMAHFCRDTIPSVCQQLAPGDPCDTPIGCICGYSGGQLICGRFH
jgi:hypothetical protein